MAPWLALFDFQYISLLDSAPDGFQWPFGLPWLDSAPNDSCGSFACFVQVSVHQPDSVPIVDVDLWLALIDVHYISLLDSAPDC